MSAERWWSTITRPEHRARAITGVAAAALAATYVATWRLWQGRTDPPNLPVVEGLDGLALAAPLVVAAAATLVVPRVGAAVHTGLLVVAVLGDQIRLQPEIVSLAILLVAGAWPAALAIGRWHLVTLWAWAGVHKVLSAGWPDDGAVFIADALRVSSLDGIVSVAVPITEVGLALLALSRRTWPALRVAAPLFHLGILATLVLEVWNRSVWPWNLALAAIVPLLFRADPAPRRGRAALVPAAATFLALYPAGFYVGLADAYPSHNLYSGNTARAWVCTDGPAVACRPAPFSATWDRLHVPLPPERRLFVDWFERICAPGDRLRIDGIDTRLFDRRSEVVACEGGT